MACLTIFPTSRRREGVVKAGFYAELDLPTYYKRQRPFSCEVKTTFIGSVAWQWLYATNLLVAYGMILTTADTPPGTNPYSWVALEAE
ncbi:MULTISPECIES: hypothetical protein [unclassified Endozoicomonas]|uniref:hypothetical protein n=1 Tax=unclassified Endozoicomonas TaxID=2644528 RepID=UPI00214871CD|nr:MULTISPECIES: hypothetical protein [unclassified Endozoicomonas]